MYYKLGQACVTNWRSFVLLQIRANVVTNWCNFVLLQIRANGVTNWCSFIITNWDKYCYKLGQLLQIGATFITKWGSFYKLGQVLQIRTIITNWGVIIFVLLTYNRRATIVFGGTGCLTNYIHMEKIYIVKSS